MPYALYSLYNQSGNIIPFIYELVCALQKAGNIEGGTILKCT